MMSILKDGTKVYIDTVQGPTSYTTGGFTVSTPLNFIKPETIDCNIVTPISTGNFVYQLEVIAPDAATTNEFKIKVYRIDVTGAAGWAEVPAATDLSAMRIRIEVYGT